jgi:large subunit ribosomal protein L21
MKKYTIIRILGNQYKASEGDEILVNKLTEKPSAEVLLVCDGEKISVGKPILKSAKVTLKVVKEEEKGKKLHVSTYKSKSRYRRKIGFRPSYTRLQVQKIA